METGAQNVQISSTVLQLSFPPEQLVGMFTFPLMYGCSQLLHSLLLVSGELQDDPNQTFHFQSFSLPSKATSWEADHNPGYQKKKVHVKCTFFLKW